MRMRPIAALILVAACSETDLPEPAAPDAGDARDASVTPAPESDATAGAHDAGDPAATAYLVGAAKTDITGPFVGSSTGYNSPGEELNGLAMRLYARAFVVADPAALERPVALVTADMIHLYQSVKQGVVKELAQRGLGSTFGADNILLSATHTHSAPSNISWYTLFNLFNGVVGFDPVHYRLVVSGIADAIERAHGRMTPANIRLARGRVQGAAHNRSLPAYLENQDSADYDMDVDDRLTLLRFDAHDGTPIGLLNWFGVHGTSLGIDNRFEHGDNKGWAAYAFEQRMPEGFVAAFAQGTFGDVSPNLPDPEDRAAAFLRPHQRDEALHPLEDPIVHGQAQLTAAQRLYDTAGDALPVNVSSRHLHVSFNQVPVGTGYQAAEMPWDSETSRGTCTAVIGGGFLAGDEEGAPIALAEEGVIRNRYIAGPSGYLRQEYSLLELPGVQAALGLLWPLSEAALRTDKHDACHKEKFVLLPVGDVGDFWLFSPDVPFVPVTLPFQVVRVGPLAIAAVPFEITTMAGRRLESRLLATLSAAGISEVVVAGMANAYAQYLTTREEYAVQHFEGAFTTFGPWSSDAVVQEVDRLAQSLVDGRAVPQGAAPQDLSNRQWILTPVADQGVPQDAPGAGFGRVLVEPAGSYQSSHDQVTVVFQGAHPRHVQVLQAAGQLDDFYEPDGHTYLDVQRETGRGFETVAGDDDPYTSLQWEKTSDEAGSSKVSIRWLVRDQPPGRYRIRYQGLARTGADAYQAFTGTSSIFTLR